MIGRVQSAEAAAASEPTDCRHEPRIITVHRTSAVETETGQGLCVIKNLSTGGALVRTLLPLAVGAPLVLVMASGRRVAGSVRWVNPPEAGIRFDTAQELSAILDRGGLSTGGAHRRMPRLEVTLPAIAVQDDVAWAATTCDLSCQGVRLRCTHELALGRVQLRLPGLRPLFARALWGVTGQFGCIFDAPLTIDELTSWLIDVEHR